MHVNCSGCRQAELNWSIFFTEKPDDKLLLAVYQPIKTYDEYPCEIMSVPRDFRKIGNGLIFQKGWAYTNLINFHLHKVRIHIHILSPILPLKIYHT